MTTILNYGGGTQTAAMCILVARGVLPMPDYIIAADTGREMPSTWQYLNDHIQPLLAPHGLTVHIASHDLATVDLYGHNGDLLVPVYTSTGKLPTFCSSEWKASVVRRYARTVLGVKGAIENWIGFSLDEKRRIKDRDGRAFPLADLMISTEDCRRIILDAGLPLPKKSRCFMCPHQHNAEWREVKTNPALWQLALDVDDEVRENDERGGLFLHRQRVPLRDALLDTDDRAEPSRQCGLGQCFL